MLFKIVRLSLAFSAFFSIAALSAVWILPSLLDSNAAAHETRVRTWLESGAQCRASSTRTDLGPYNRVFDHLVVLEDRSFWNRPSSFDIRGLLRAVWVNLSAREIVQGGSGIPQQLVGLAMLNDQAIEPSQSIRHKMLQFIIASRIFHSYPRGVIEVAYLDQLPCGPVTGVRACAVYTFGAELDIDDPLHDARAGLLAAQVLAPTRLRVDESALHRRADYARLQLSSVEGSAPGPSTSEIALARHRRAATAMGASAVCEARAIDFTAALVPALEAGIRAASASVSRGGSSPQVIAFALWGDTLVSVAGNWEHHSFPGGSWAKVWLLSAITHLGPPYDAYLYDIRLPPNLPVWDFRLRSWWPSSTGMLDEPISLLEAVARSHNQASLNYLYFPYWLDTDARHAFLDLELTDEESSRFTTNRDHELALGLLERATGYPYLSIPEAADPDLNYRELLLLSLRQFRKAVERDLPGANVPEVPAALLGSGFSAKPEQWLRGFKRAWFVDGYDCVPTRSGVLLAQQMGRKGTLHSVMSDLGLSAPAKTGTTRESAQAALGLCWASSSGEVNPLIIAFFVFDHRWRPLRGVQGASLAPGLLAAVRALPGHAEPMPSTPLASEIPLLASKETP